MRVVCYGLLEDLYPEVVPLFAIHPDLPYERLLRQDDSANAWRDARVCITPAEFDEKKSRAEKARVRAQKAYRVYEANNSASPTPPVTIIPYVGSIQEENDAKTRIILDPNSTLDELGWALR